MDSQQTPTTFNQRVGANLQRIRQAAGWSQADLASRLADLGLPFQQPTILKVEKGTRPLKFEEAHAIAEILEINMASLTQHVDDVKAAEAIAQIERSNVIISRTFRQREEASRQREAADRQTLEWLERVKDVKRTAEQELRDAGGHQDDEGRWWWQDKPLALDATVTPATIATVASVPAPTLSTGARVRPATIATVAVMPAPAEESDDGQH